MSCKCDQGSPNTGFPSCLGSDSPLIGFLVVNRINSSGGLFNIPNATTKDAAWLTGLINAADDKDRVYPLFKMENVVQDAPEPVTEEAASGTIEFIKEGVRTVSGEFFRQSRQFKGQVDQWRCQDKAVYPVYLNGDVYGKCIDDSGDLYPITIENGSWVATFVEATDTTVSKVSLSFQYNQIEDVKDFYKFTKDEYTADITGSKGLMDVNGTVSGITDTQFTIELETIFGTKENKEKLTGLVPGDFSLFNLDDALAVTILTAAESPSGTYTITYASQDSAETLQLTVTTAGFDTSTIPDIPILIP